MAATQGHYDQPLVVTQGTAPSSKDTSRRWVWHWKRQERRKHGARGRGVMRTKNAGGLGGRRGWEGKGAVD